MNATSMQKLEQAISTHISWLSSRLVSLANQKKLPGKFSNGCRSNENGLLVGWVGYLPHNERAEEAIELLFTLSGETKNSKKNFEIGIYWSDGSVIEEISEDDIDLNDIVAQVDSIIEQSKSKLLSKMIREISVDRPPHYRKD